MAKAKLVDLIPKEELIATIRRGLNGKPPSIDTALLIVASAFHGHNDRNGQAYVRHLLQVFTTRTHSVSKIIVGILHDLIEDTCWTLDDLRRVGFSDHVVRAIDFVTKRPDELYFDGVVRCGTSVTLLPVKHRYLAVDAKLADLRHNMDVSRETRRLPPDYLARLPVYNVAYNYLVAIKKEGIVPETAMTGFMEAYPDLYDENLLRKNSSDPRRTPLVRLDTALRLVP